MPVPSVAEDERLLVKPLEYPGFFRVVARYGYLDLVDHGPAFVKLLLIRLQLEQKFLVASLASGSRVKPLQSQVLLRFSPFHFGRAASWPQIWSPTLLLPDIALSCYKLSVSC